MLPPAAGPQDELLPPGASETPGEEVIVPDESETPTTGVPQVASGQESDPLHRLDPDEKEVRRFKKNLVVWVASIIVILIVIAILSYLGPIQ